MVKDAWPSYVESLPGVCYLVVSGRSLQAQGRNKVVQQDFGSRN
jgi:hypothetical protein